MYPCDDELILNSLSEFQEVTKESHGHGHRGESDHCSPFCVCAISSVIRIDNPEIKPIIALKFATPNFIYLAPFSAAVPVDIFQPPRV